MTETKNPPQPTPPDAPSKGLPSVNAIAAQVHEQWRAERDRSYSPFNKPWDQLTWDERRQVSRQSAMCLRIAGVPHVDEFGDVPPAPPAPQIQAAVKDIDLSTQAALASAKALSEMNRTVDSPQVRADTLRLSSIELATEAVKAIADIARAGLGTSGVPVVGVIRVN